MEKVTEKELLKKIDQTVEEYYQQIKKECRNYEELNQRIKELSFCPVSDDVIYVCKKSAIEVMLTKIEKERNRLPIR